MQTDATRTKQCLCGNVFPVELNRRGQVTSRKLCDDCRERRSRDELNIPPNAPRCNSCGALVGRQFGEVLNLVDGLCQSCLKWRKRREEREELKRRGWEFRGGLAFPPREPLGRQLRKELEEGR